MHAKNTFSLKVYFIQFYCTDNKFHIQAMYDQTESKNKNGANYSLQRIFECEPECGSNISHTPIPSEMNDEPFPIGRAEGPQGFEFASNPSPNEREFVSVTRTNTDDKYPMQLEMQRKDKDIDVEQTVVNSTPTSSNSAATIAIKPRKSNRSRKASKRRRIKNSF